MDKHMTEVAELRHKIRRLTKVLEMSVSEAMTIEVTGWLETARARLAELEPEERDTPKLNALMRDDDAVTFMETSHQDFGLGPTLEQMLMIGHDQLLKPWVKSLSPVQLGIMQAMAPRLAHMVNDEAFRRHSLAGPGDQIQHRKFIDRGPLRNDRKPGTELLNDTEPGSFDD